jgi:hypothetical protein
MSGQMIVTPDATIVYQTAGLEHLLRMLAGDPGNYTRYMPAQDVVPDPIRKLLRQITGAANGSSNTPPHLRIVTAHGVLTLNAIGLSLRTQFPRMSPGTRRTVLSR